MSKIIPRYLYHLTTKCNYEKIVEGGRILAQPEEFAGSSIFMFELQNFVKRWRFTDFYDKKSKLNEALVNFCKKDDSGFVLLRIPTCNLKSEKLRIRNQEALFTEYKRLNKIYEKKYDQYSRIRHEQVMSKFDKIDKTGMRECEKEEVYARMMCEYMEQHPKPKFEDIVKEYGDPQLTSGDFAKNRRLYQQRKNAIEYIYPDDISTIQLEKVGECSPEQSANDIFPALLKGRPEFKALFVNG